MFRVLVALLLLNGASCHIGTARLLRLTGGNLVDEATPVDEPVIDISLDASPVGVMVTTSFGSQFLDKKKRIQLKRNSTIAELKEMIEQKFPANPPVVLQRLFSGLRYLQDDDLIGNITTGPNVQVLLDMPSGTSVYNKSLTISQALEAHSSLIVQQTYLADKLKSLYESSSQQPLNASEVTPDSAVYRELFVSLNESIYRNYQEDIWDALELEKEPEAFTEDTAAWRGPSKPRSPLVALFAKEFDINLRSFKSFVYFSFLFAFFSYFGTSTEFSSQILIAMVPVMWVSKLRQLRLVSKVLS
jgi:hypothetical protein